MSENRSNTSAQADLSKAQTPEKSSTSAIKDACPSWASEAFIKIQALEIRLGNIRETAAQWQSVEYDELIKRAEADDQFAHADNEMVEALFVRTCQILSEEGFEPADIAAFANARIGAGGKLSYCSPEEVAESIT